MNTYKQKQTKITDMILNLLAEHNLDIIEEVTALKRGIKGAFGQLAEDIKSSFNELSEENRINEKKLNATLDNMKEKIVIW